MDNSSDQTISFDNKGNCNYCNDVIKRMPYEYFPNEQGKQKLDAIMKKIKHEGVHCDYDCLVGVSGGVDSSYLIYLGHKYNLRMLAVHIDDGLDTPTAKENIENLCKKANLKLINISPNKEQYADLLLSFFKASVPNLAMPQDNLLFSELFKTTKKYNIKYSLIGDNFSQESILERFENINPYDKKHILSIHKEFGTKDISDLNFLSIYDRYIKYRYISKMVKISPLNYMDYNLKIVLKELNDFSGFEYYGAKHFESILTRFLQSYYLPKRYNFDKRKSHLSSLVVSKQLSRSEAIDKLNETVYTDEMLISDKNSLAEFMNISLSEFNEILEKKPRMHHDYKTSYINKLSPIARKFRKFLG